MRLAERVSAITAFALALLLAACAAQGPGLAQFGAGSERLELKDTAFFPSEERYAAAAALATLLYTDGVRVGPESVAPKLGAAGGAVELQPALRAAAGSFDRLAYVLAPKLDDLIKELAAGHPVLVLLNLGSAPAAPAWRYAVVIGYDPATDALLLRSGKQGRAGMTPAAFLAAWKDGGNFALVLGEAAKIPATATLERWIAASESLTQAGKPALAEAAASAALARWPEQPLLPMVALGNARYAKMDWLGSQAAYVKALALDDRNPVVHNNLALVLLERKCIDLAEREVAVAIERETDPALRAAYAATDAKIKRYSGTSIFCPPPDADAQAPIEYEVLPLNPDSLRAPKALRKSPPKKAR
ncbi:MAG: hypothetical protein NVS9B10_16100 [Nevskia sp.]